jgi:transposase-like protein
MKKRLSTNVGTIEVALPRDRSGTFEPVTVKKHERRLGRLEDTVMFLYSKGMSTRDIQEHFEEAYGAELSPSAIAHITSSVMAQASEWQNRELESTYPIVFFDALYLKVREESKVVVKAAYTCLAIRCDGMKELLGIWIGDAESSAFWAGVMTELQNRGVRDILIACVDGIKGFAEAMNAIFPNTQIQRCIIHQVRSSFRLVTWKDQKAVARSMREIYTAPTNEAAEAALDSLDEQWGKTYPSLIDSWRKAWPELSSFLKYP